MHQTAIDIVKKFQQAGFEAYFAGGSVRDMLMEKEPVDYDIATSARPEEIERIMTKTFPVGRQFGVILAEENGHHFEIATFRSDAGYSDGRRPDAVLFTDAKQDALRRDFTINGLFFDPVTNAVLDYVDGQKDIYEKQLRFIGEAHERIKEDHLRLLRGVRFKNNLGFSYDEPAEAAIKDLHHLVDDISRERVRGELDKILVHPRRAHSLKELDEFGILERILPEVTACKEVVQPYQYHQEGDVFTHILKSLHDMPAEFVSKEMVWAVLLHDIGKPATFFEGKERVRFDGHADASARMAREVCRRMKMGRAELTKIGWLVEHHMTVGFIPQMRRAHQVSLFWHPWFEELMHLHYCDEHGSHPVNLSLYEEVMKLYHEFKEEKLLECHCEPFLDGNDLIREFGVEPGPVLKELIVALKEARIERVVNSREEAVKFVEGYLSQG